jgi:putative tryptophan/tyrosine transport system substrate-binding protein
MGARQRSAWCLIFLVVVFAAAHAGAEEGRRPPRVGQLYGTNPSIAKPYDEAFRDGLRSLGYVDGKNIVLLPRYAHGDPKQFPGLLSELIALNVDVLVVAITALPAAMQATRTIPIVAPSMGDPVRDGFVTTLAHPGGNLTGGAGMGPEVESKRLQFAMEVVPGLARAGLLFEATNPGLLRGANETRGLANELGVTLRTYGVRNSDEIRSALGQFDKDRLQALFVWNTPLMLLHRDSIMESAKSQRMPVISESREFAEAGALITYAANYVAMWGHSAVYIDKILKGAKPGDLPIEQPTKFQLIVNLKAARALHITIPESILLLADEVIR